MDIENLKGFLKDYAAAAQDLGGLKDYAPFTSHVSMAHGSCTVRDKNGHAVCGFGINHLPDGSEADYCPSVPIDPLAMALSDFVAKCANEFCGVQA